MQKTEAEGSTLMQPDLRLGADLLVCATPEMQNAFLESLTDSTLTALPWLFEFWAMEHQLPPEGDWRSWVIMGGRGAGKTRAGSEWVRAQVEGARPLDAGRARRVALVGETFDQVRDVMVFGDSGIMACSPPDRVPEWKATARKLVWPNGAEAQCFTASEPEMLRGPQFDAAWVDELAKWKKGQATWDMLQFALRLGDDPRCVVTTTPRNVGVLKEMLKRASTVVTHAKTEANRANLAGSFLEEVKARYGGTRLGRQELDGVLLDDAEGAMWNTKQLEAGRVSQLPQMERIVVAVDPSVTANAGSDECGIVVFGVSGGDDPRKWTGYVIEDATISAASPVEWAQRAIDVARKHGADRVVAEVNQGGDLVEEMLRQLDPLLPYRAVRASKGKAARAEPVAALYEQGRIRHLGAFGALEDQMVQMTPNGFLGRGSPDRVDALVWAAHDAMIAPAAKWSRPQVRVL